MTFPQKKVFLFHVLYILLFLVPTLTTVPFFFDQVNMWVFEEMVNGEKLTDIINTRHENVKYLPGKPS